MIKKVKGSASTLYLFMAKLLIATKNTGKFHEIKSALTGSPFEIVDLSSFHEMDDFEEGEGSYEHNAVGKAFYFHRLTGVLTTADDSGIEVDAFPGQLGVLTRRWGGEGASDQEWIELFLQWMKDVPQEKRGATFVCAAAVSGIVNGVRVIQVFRGETRGLITPELQAPLIPGIPLSSCFIPEGCGKVYAALTPFEKDKISHRGKAFFRLREFLEKFTV